MGRQRVERDRITKRVVDAAKPAAQDYIIWDSELHGFGLKVAPGGRKTYVLFYRTHSGQQRKPTIGQHGALTADEARAIAKQWLAQVKLGGDPSRERQEKRKAETVKELAERYLIEHAEARKKPRSIATDRANIANHVLPLMGSMKVADVTAADIEKVKHAIATGKTAKAERRKPDDPEHAANKRIKPRGRRIVKGGKGIANRVLALLGKMFALAEKWGLRQGNPVRGVDKYKEQPRDRFLSPDEIKKLHGALDAATAAGTENPFAIAAIRFTLYTGLRHGTVANLRWREVDLAHGCLRLEDTKTGALTVAISTHAATVLNSLPAGEPDDLVFPSSKEGAPIALTRPFQRIRKAAGIDASVTLHTLRHTLASWAVMGGMSLPETGALLGHKSVQTTQRYAHLAQDHIRRNAERVASTIAAMAAGESKPAEVTPLHKRAG